MGLCYWHEYETYPGHECPKCEESQMYARICERQLRFFEQRYGIHSKEYKELKKELERRYFKS